jgi:hypothetical protein
MRQLALRIAERSTASFEGLLGWIAVSCVSTAYQQKVAGVGGGFVGLSTKVGLGVSLSPAWWVSDCSVRPRKRVRPVPEKGLEILQHPRIAVVGEVGHRDVSSIG